MPSKEYSLIINLDKDIIPTVEEGRYLPIVEILPPPILKILPDEQVNQWVDINDRPEIRFPPLKNSEGKPPTVLQHDTKAEDGSHFDVVFSGPEPDSKTIWFAVHIERAPVDENDKNSARWPLEFDRGSVGSVFSIDENGAMGKIAPGGKNPAIPESAESVGLVIEAKMTLFFWILDKTAEKPKLQDAHQAIDLLPGTARIQLPPAASECLQIKVWLEGQSEPDLTHELVTFQDQSHKRLVSYSPGDQGVQQIHMNAAGFWAEQKELSKRLESQKKLVRRSTKLSETIKQFDERNGAVNGLKT